MPENEPTEHLDGKDKYCSHKNVVKIEYAIEKIIGSWLSAIEIRTMGCEHIVPEK